MADQIRQPGPPKKPLTLTEQISQQRQEYEQQVYQKLVEQVKPKPKVLVNALNAFWVGGVICAIGQLITLAFRSGGFPSQDAANATTMVMIFLGAFLTGLGIYDQIGKFAGAGSIIPITGFANSIVSPALEFKREGFIFGVGSRLFMVAGPVIIYGLVTSVIVGLIAYLTS